MGKERYKSILCSTDRKSEAAHYRCGDVEYECFIMDDQYTAFELTA